MATVIEIRDQTNPTAATPVATVAPVDWHWTVDDELGDTVTFSVPVDDADYAELTAGRLARVVDGGTEMAEGVVGVPEVTRRRAGQVESDEAPVATFRCEGAVNILGGGHTSGASVYPEYGLGRPHGDTRWFGPMQAGYDTSTWDAATSIGTQGSPPATVSAYRGAPDRWPDPSAHWLGPQTLDADGRMSPNGQAWPIRVEFTTSQAHDARLFVAMDNYGWLWLDGVQEIVIPDSRRAGWSQITSAEVDLAAGDHVIFGWIIDSDRRPATGDPTALLLSLIEIDTDGELGSVIARTDNSGNWKSLDNPASVPGVTPGSIGVTLLGEVSTRASDASQMTPLDNVTETYTATVDSDGVAWPDEVVQGFDVGAGYVQVFDQLRQFADVDVAMLPGLQLSMWTSRGEDKGITPTTSTVALHEGPAAGANVVESNYTADTAADPNVLLLGVDQGFVERTEAGTSERREATARFGRQPFGDTLDQWVAHTFAEYTLTGQAVVFTDGTDATPKVDVDVGDIVQAPDRDGAAADWTVTQMQGHDDGQAGDSLYMLTLTRVS